MLLQCLKHWQGNSRGKKPQTSNSKQPTQRDFQLFPALSLVDVSATLCQSPKHYWAIVASPSSTHTNSLRLKKKAKRFGHPKYSVFWYTQNILFNYHLPTHTFCFLHNKLHAIAAWSAKVVLPNTTPSLLLCKVSNYIILSHENTAVTGVTWTDYLLSSFKIATSFQQFLNNSIWTILRCDYDQPYFHCHH